MQKENTAMGQIPRSIERISSLFNNFNNNINKNLT